MISCAVNSIAGFVKRYYASHSSEIRALNSSSNYTSKGAIMIAAVECIRGDGGTKICSYSTAAIITNHYAANCNATVAGCLDFGRL